MFDRKWLFKLETAFHMQSLRKLIGISWMSRTPNTDKLSGRGLPTMFVHQASGSDNERQKNSQKYFYGELIAGKSTLGTPITLSGRVQAKYEY